MANDGQITLKTKVDQKGLKSGLSSMVKTTGKAFAVVATAAATATVAITKMAVSAYADYEQLVGGVETLFKGSASKVLEYANQAFETAGVSANEYMEKVTSFSASLISSTAGDTEKAADVANMAMIDMADNANKMGSTLESISTAYQGFAKGQYMLLDNLKLGYGGTKTEMERLLKDAEAYLATQGKSAKLSINNLADVYTGINAIQEKLGIAGTTMKEGATTISGSLGMVKASWENLLVAISTGMGMDRAVNNFVYSLEKLTSNLTPVIERVLIGLGDAVARTLPTLIQTVVVALVQQIPNLVVAVYNMILGLFKGIVQGIKALFKGGTAKATEVIKGNVESMASGANSTAHSMEDVAENTKKAAKEAKKATAAFDELNILSSGGGGASGAGESATAMPDIATSASGGTGEGIKLFDDVEAEIDATLTTIMAIAGLSLVAIGLLMLFLGGNVLWGIGFIVAGATTFGVAAANSAKNNVATEVVGVLTTIMGIAGGALLALGIILLYFKTAIPTAIGLIVAGASLIVSSGATKGIFNPNDIKGWLSLITGIVGGALLAIGVFLCYMNVVPLGVGMIVAGALSVVSSVALNEGALTEKIKGWVAVIMGIAGAALLVLGIILCFTPMLPLAISLIAVGAIALVTPIALNWNAIKNKISEIFTAIGNWIKTWGLLVLGIILCVSGVGIPLGIALMKKGGANLTEAQSPLWNTIVDKVKSAWNAIKAFWNTHIAKWFTKEHWANLAKNMMNGLISKIEAGLNKLLKKFHDANIGKAIDYIAGGLGFTIPESITIPRLAKGAVIPPNREFLAVLGDQKHGTNIEAPLQTIVDAFNIALSQNGGAGGGTTEVILEVDGREFGRAVVEQGNRENRRIGTRLVIV
jgi:hypothetical protein